jgi:carbamoyltransferase
MNILGMYGGVTMGQHDPSAALVCDGRVVAACEEERFLRVKSPWGVLPIHSVRACLDRSGLSMEDIDLVAHPGETYEDMPERVGAYLRHYFGYAPPLRVINHHLAHAASAFHCSGFDRAMCLSYDAYGDRLSAALGVGTRERGVEVLETRPRENSLGQFYASITSFLGFLVGEDEYKVMGLAAYGREGVNLSPFVDVAPDGYAVEMSFLPNNWQWSTNYEPFYSERLVELLGPPRRPGRPITARHQDIAFAAQRALERCAAALVTRLHERTGLYDLCLAGGCALNCAANQALLALPCVRRIFVQPAASDRGLALGCALQAAFDACEPPTPQLVHAALGPEYSDAEVRRALEETGTDYVELSDPAASAAEMLTQGKIIGWFQGRSEFGPRALGHRSILADPRRAEVKAEVNARVKYREGFRPFAPAVLEERAWELFGIDGASPFMTVTYPVAAAWRNRLQAVTHVDGTARVQTVARCTEPLFHRLIEEFDRLTGVPAVLNTSFNVRGQPIVETPLDALSTFAGTGLDALFMGPFLTRKLHSVQVASAVP